MKHSLVVEKVGESRKLRLLFLFNDVLVCAGQKKSLKYTRDFLHATRLIDHAVYNSTSVSANQWLNYSARGGGSLQARGLKDRSSSPKGREQRWGSRPPTRGFRAFKALCLVLWHLNNVLRLQHLSTPSVDKCKRQNDREGLHFLQNITVQSVDPSKKVPDLSCAVQDLLLEEVDLK